MSFNHLSLIVSVIGAGVFILFPTITTDVLNDIINYLLTTFDTFFLWTISLILIICIGLILSPFSKNKLGGENAKTEFSTFSWIAMLFAAGMGSGLIFWGVAEPIYHLNSPLNTLHDGVFSLAITDFHWGLHAWAIYAFSGLVIGWFSYNEGREMTISASFTKENSSIYQLFDVLAVVAILFGVAGTLANSIALIETGVQSIISENIGGLTFRFLLLAFISLVFIASSLSGLNKGVKYLSNFNVALALLLLLIVAYLVGFGNVLNYFFESSIAYIKALPTLSFVIAEGSESWSHGWTIIYFLWWISWAPFTGLFIARISKGRTIREFLFGVILYPTIITIIWFATFGGGGFLAENFKEIQTATNTNYTLGLFTLLNNFGIGNILGLLSIGLLTTFVITSADSAIYVTVLLTKKTSMTNKLIWSAVLIGISSALLIRNNLDLNKVIAITGAIPFVLILIAQGIKFLIVINKKR
ncbi:BCCT transporter [Flammeovirga pectinis]|uniref:BCCT transporter n=1 Tax=Flammeovirga pectinis TaxID=2494373 RepID=A0A3Q9FR77_9BACT|nr:BCCT transporter [Flammeovirga pectinis]